MKALDGNYLLDCDFCIQDMTNPDSRLWTISFRRLDQQSGEYTLDYYARVNAADGAIIDVDDNKSGVG